MWIYGLEFWAYNIQGLTVLIKKFLRRQISLNSVKFINFLAIKYVVKCY